MNDLNWIELAVIVALVLLAAVLGRKYLQVAGMLTERTQKIRETIEHVQEHAAIPYSRFLHPPSQPLNSGRPVRHSAPVSMPINRAPLDPWYEYFTGEN